MRPTHLPPHVKETGRKHRRCAKHEHVLGIARLGSSRRCGGRCASLLPSLRLLRLPFRLLRLPLRLFPGLSFRLEPSLQLGFLAGTSFRLLPGLPLGLFLGTPLGLPTGAFGGLELLLPLGLEDFLFEPGMGVLHKGVHDLFPVLVQEVQVRRPFAIRRGSHLVLLWPERAFFTLHQQSPFYRLTEASKTSGFSPGLSDYDQKYLLPSTSLRDVVSCPASADLLPR